VKHLFREAVGFLIYVGSRFFAYAQNDKWNCIIWAFPLIEAAALFVHTAQALITRPVSTSIANAFWFEHDYYD